MVEHKWSRIDGQDVMRYMVTDGFGVGDLVFNSMIDILINMINRDCIFIKQCIFSEYSMLLLKRGIE